MTPASTAPSQRLARMAAVAALLALYYVMALSAASQKSMTFDEMAHLTGGYTYWAFNDYRLHPENGNWPQRLGALPAVLGGSNFPRLDQPGMDDRPTSMRSAISSCTSSGNDADTVLRRGRAVMALLGVALGALVYAMGQATRVSSRGMARASAVCLLAHAAGSRRARHVGHGGGAVLHGGSWLPCGRRCIE